MADEIVASQRKDERNRSLFEAVLNGTSFKEAGVTFGVSPVRARGVFLNELRKAGEDLWGEGADAGLSGAYAAPSLKWVRANKDRVLDAIMAAEVAQAQQEGQASKLAKHGLRAGDRDLIELAAKAAGIDLSESTWMNDAFVFRAPRTPNWNPLTDDGDALRLAVKLSIKITPGTYNKDEFSAYKAAGGEAHEYRHYQQDEFAATRRAIVRAAAEIGRREGGA